MPITSISNEKIKYLKKLIAKRSFREEEGRFVIEGARAVRDAADMGADLIALFLREGERVPASLDTVETVYTLAPHVFDKVAATKSPQGVLAIVAIPSADMEHITGSAVVFCENLQDPGNLGTIIRTAAAVGASGVILSEGCVDLFNPKTVRATMSALFSLPIVTGRSAAEAFSHFREKGYRVLGAALSEDAADLYETILPQRSLIVIGNEGNGITKETLALCGQGVRIPMPGDVESLNAAIAAAVILYEHYRQNRE